MIVLVFLKVFGQTANSLGQQCNLNFGRASITVTTTEVFDYIRFFNNR